VPQAGADLRIIACQLFLLVFVPRTGQELLRSAN
jgi:hypothetical protein